MHVALHIADAELGRAFHAYVERRLRFALGRFGAHVGQVTVRIDTNGRANRRCRITAQIVPVGHVTVEEDDPELFAAIDRATGRIGRLFGRALERGRDSRLGRESIRTAA